MKKYIILLFIVLSFASCKKDDPIIEESDKELTIFFVNDVHGRIDNFSKIKHIVEQEEAKTNVIVTSSGDIFSGNPIVDIYDPKGYPMIDLMNKIGFDVMAIGNHEFDYGESVFYDRLNQSDFPWLCANVDPNSIDMTDPLEYTTLKAGDVSVTFLGLIETNGKEDDIIPSTHPAKIENFTFTKPEDIVSNYTNLKTTENSDLIIGLTHLGFYDNLWNYGDYSLAQEYSYFDVIIGGHTNHLLDNTVINNIPILQAGNNLNYLGKIELKINEKSIVSYNVQLIDLDTYSNHNQTVKTLVEDYNNSMPFLNDVIGYSHDDHTKFEIGCFYTDAFANYLAVDVSFQNSGGVRSGLDLGDITKSEIYAISPFNNSVIIYDMTVLEIKEFIKGSGTGLYYSGIQINRVGETVEIRDEGGDIIADNVILSVGINGYIPTVFSSYFPDNGVVQANTAAETLIAYLETINDQVDYNSCGRYFRFD